MAYNTGNPVPSTDAKDFVDNCENLDSAMNSTSAVWTDRLGESRKTLSGITQEFDSQIAAQEVEHNNQIAAHEIEHDNQIAAHEAEFSAQLQAQGWNPVSGSFEAGGTIVNRSDILWWEAAKSWYSWQGDLTINKTVPPGSTPTSAGGVASDAWVDRTDGALRAEITPSVTETLRRSYAEAGLNLVDGSFEAGGTLTSASDVLLHKASGIAYSWGGVFPKVVAAGSTPTPLGSGGWVDRSIVTLRSELADDGGSELVGFRSETVSDAIYRTYNKMTDPNIPLSNIIAALRADKTTPVNIIPICDSFGDGVGASDYRNRYMKVFEWALNYSNPDGFGFASDTRLTDAVNVANSGITTNGTSGAQGALESRVTLAAGQYIDVTGVQIDYADLWYDGGLTTGNIQIYLNGSLVRTVTTTKTAGIKTTLDGTKLNARTSKTDVIRFQATGGTVSVSALNILRGPSGGLWQAKVSHGGWSYKTYDNQAIVDEIAAYSQWRGAYAVYMFMLGTNSIYNGSEAQTPAEMIASMQSLIAKLSAKTPNCGFIVGVPPKANESLWPVIKSGFTHDDYVKALINFGETNGIQLVRFDTLNLAEKGLYSDGVHPTNNGHVLYAKRLCESVGIPCIPYADDTQSISQSTETSSAITFNSTWGTFLNDPGSVPRVRKIGNIGYLSGSMQPNGSTSLTVMTIPAEYRPKLRNVNCNGWDINGSTWVQIPVSISSSGSVQLASLPTLFVSLEGSWVIDNAS